MESEPKLPLFSLPQMLVSTEPSGVQTPPLESSRSASVPFVWEEEPGKPRLSTALIALPLISNKCFDLQLPPRLQQQQHTHCCYSATSIFTKSPSPTTLFHHPLSSSSSSSRFSSVRHHSCDALLLQNKSLGRKGSGLFSSWAPHKPHKSKELEGNRKDSAEGSLVFSPYYMDHQDQDDYYDIEKNGSRKVNGGFLTVSPPASSNFWATMFKRFRQLVPWKKRRSKKKRAFIS